MLWRHKFKSKEEYNAWYRDYRERNREKVRAYARKYQAKWRKLHKNDDEVKFKQKVRVLAYCALKLGKLKKQTCSICGSSVVEMHHEDYSKPLDVIWLCKTHHEDKRIK